MKNKIIITLIFLLLFIVISCQSTARLTPDLEQRLIQNINISKFDEAYQYLTGSSKNNQGNYALLLAQFLEKNKGKVKEKNASEFIVFLIHQAEKENDKKNLIILKNLQYSRKESDELTLEWSLGIFDFIKK
ncbi:MAG: hypothetical protein PHV06_12240 [bacterium]|nr:hypothetical protein [bacterium]